MLWAGLVCINHLLLMSQHILAQVSPRQNCCDFFFPPYHSLCYMLLSMSSGHSPGDFCSGLCSCRDLFSETDNELSMQHAYPVHQEISDEILPMHYGRTFTRERKKRVKPAQLSSIRDLTQLNEVQIPYAVTFTVYNYE